MVERKRSWSQRLADLNEPISSPDGVSSWIVCCANFGLFFSAGGVMFTFGVVYVGLLDYFSSGNTNATAARDSSGNFTGNHTNTTNGINAIVAAIGSTSLLVSCLFAPLFGSLINKIGTRPVVIMAAVFMILGQVLTSLTTQLWQSFLTYGIFVGLSLSIVYTVCWGVLPLYFDKRRALACGVTNSGKFLGTAIVGPWSATLQEQYGWRTALQISSCLGIVMLFCGLIYRPIKLLQTDRNVTEGRKRGIRELLLKFFYLHKNVRFVFWLFTISVINASLYLPIYHIVRHAEDDLATSPSKAGLLLTVMALSAGVTNVAVGLVAEKTKHKMLILQLLLLSGGISTMLLSFYKTYDHLVVYMIVYGISLGYTSLVSVISVNMVGIQDSTDALAAVTLYTVSMMIGPPVAGWMYDDSGSYHDAFMLFGAIIVVTALLLFLDIPLARIKPRTINSEKQKCETEMVTEQRF